MASLLLFSYFHRYFAICQQRYRGRTLRITVKSRALNTWYQHVIRSHDGKICSGVRQHLRMRRCSSPRFDMIFFLLEKKKKASHSYKNTERLSKIQLANDKTEKPENPQYLVI